MKKGLTPHPLTNSLKKGIPSLVKRDKNIYHQVEIQYLEPDFRKNLTSSQN